MSLRTQLSGRRGRDERGIDVVARYAVYTRGIDDGLRRERGIGLEKSVRDQRIIILVHARIERRRRQPRQKTAYAGVRNRIAIQVLSRLGKIAVQFGWGEHAHIVLRKRLHLPLALVSKEEKVPVGSVHHVRDAQWPAERASKLVPLQHGARQAGHLIKVAV